MSVSFENVLYGRADLNIEKTAEIQMNIKEM